MVIAVLQGKKSGHFACRVAYGTKKLKIVQRQHLDVIIQNAGHLRQFGLGRATRFDLDYVSSLPWLSDFFGCWSNYPTPVIGALTEIYIREFAYLMMRRQTPQS